MSPRDLETQFDFLKTECDIALTLLRLSEIEGKDNAGYSTAALVRARDVLEVIGRYLNISPFTAEQVAFLEERRNFITAKITALS